MRAASSSLDARRVHTLRASRGVATLHARVRAPRVVFIYSSFGFTPIQPTTRRESSSRFVAEIAGDRCALPGVTVYARGHGSRFLLPHHVPLLHRTVTRLAGGLRLHDVR